MVFVCSPLSLATSIKLYPSGVPSTGDGSIFAERGCVSYAARGPICCGTPASCAWSESFKTSSNDSTSAALESDFTNPRLVQIISIHFLRAKYSEPATQWPTPHISAPRSNATAPHLRANGNDGCTQSYEYGQQHRSQATSR